EYRPTNSGYWVELASSTATLGMAGYGATSPFVQALMKVGSPSLCGPPSSRDVQPVAQQGSDPKLDVVEATFGSRSYSIAAPKFDTGRGLAACAASLAPQLPLERHQACVAGPPLQKRSVRNDRLVSAGMATRAHKVEHAQILEAEGVARRHGSA